MYFRYIIYLLIISSNLYPEGFAPNTLIKTKPAHSTIEKLHSNDSVISYFNNTLQEFSITHTNCYIVNKYVLITVGNEQICTTVDQKFYSYNHKCWVNAITLKAGDLLMNCYGKAIMINAVSIINKSCKIHQLSIKNSHTFCVSSYDIIAHNSPEAIVSLVAHMIPTIAPVAAVTTVITPILIKIAHIGLTIGATLLGVNLIQKTFGKNKHKRQASIDNSFVNSGSPNPNHRPDPDKNDKNNKDHPHGIYEDVSYHHRNSSGRKSPCPKNGQRCLDYSIPAQAKQRIAIENDTFVILKYTSPGKYHGHLIEWKNIHYKVQNTLIRKGFVTRSGKIIKQITEKFL